jgi:catechol 2,3-dioxygenase-like lactoylglutathione lyase family enzyme
VTVTSRRVRPILFILAATAMVSAQTPPAPVAPLMVQDSMNVFRRFTADPARMAMFYGEIVGLNARPPLNVGNGPPIAQFQIGTSLLRLQPTPNTRVLPDGRPNEVTGARVLTFFVPDSAAVNTRFAQHGLPVPEFLTVGGVTRALVKDPDGQWIELVVRPDASGRLEIGLAVSDLARSRAFYREFLGLDELPPVDDSLIGVTKYPYRHGTTTVNLWTARQGSPADAISGGIQYIVSDAAAVDALARVRGVKIDQPLRNFSPTLRTIWLMDPDGITNYFAQVLPAQGPAAPSR